mgnify:CR=1 FL=1
MRKKKQTMKLSLIDWCDQQVADGHDLKLHWEGGGDSGWCYFTIDGENAENKTVNINKIVLGDKAKTKIIKYVPHGLNENIFFTIDEKHEKYLSSI